MKNFTLFALVRIALKHLVVLLLSAVVFAAAAFAYCEFVALPVYSANGSVLVTNGAIIKETDSESSTLDNTDITASRNFLDTVIDILKTRGIFEQLSEQLGNDCNYKELLARTTVTDSDNNSLFINITFTANTSEEAVDILNRYLELAPSYINSYVPGTAAVAVTKADTAVQTYPRTFVFCAGAAIVGAAAAFAVILLIYSVNTVIRGEDDFKERFDIPVIGCIPDFAAARTDKYYKKSYYGGYYGRKEVESNEKQHSRSNG